MTLRSSPQSWQIFGMWGVSNFYLALANQFSKVNLLCPFSSNRYGGRRWFQIFHSSAWTIFWAASLSASLFSLFIHFRLTDALADSPNNNISALTLRCCVHSNKKSFKNILAHRSFSVLNDQISKLQHPNQSSHSKACILFNCQNPQNEILQQSQNRKSPKSFCRSPRFRTDYLDYPVFCKQYFHFNFNFKQYLKFKPLN